MFGLFKRTKIENWEIELLRHVIMKLPLEFSYLIAQINDGLFKGVLIGMSDIPGFIAFTFHSKVLKKHDRNHERDFKLTNIKVYDDVAMDFILYEVYVSSGTINGYTLGAGRKNKIDLSRIDVSLFKKEINGESDYSRIVNMFNVEERKLLNSSEVYSVYIGDKEYFHIKDLEDGDFVGIDENKIIYKITHDPMEVVVLNQNLVELLNQQYS